MAKKIKILMIDTFYGCGLAIANPEEFNLNCETVFASEDISAALYHDGKPYDVVLVEPFIGYTNPTIQKRLKEFLKEIIKEVPIIAYSTEYGLEEFGYEKGVHYNKYIRKFDGLKELALAISELTNIDQLRLPESPKGLPGKHG
jgi:hypothetical protein